MKTYCQTLAGDLVSVHVPQTPEDLRQFTDWAEQAARRGPLGLDTETTGLDIYAPRFRLRTVQFGDAHTAWVIHWELGAEFQRAARCVLDNAHAFMIHNAPYDWQVLDRHAGLPIEALAPRTTDTRILAKLIDPRERKEGGLGSALKPLSAKHIDPSAPDTQEGLTAVFNSLGFTKETGWAGISIHHPTYNLYAGLDAILAARLAPKLRTELARLDVRETLVPYEHELARICSIMTRAGMVLDIEYTETLSGQLGEQAEKFARVAARYGVTSVNSGAQISEALGAMGETLTERTDNGALKVDKNVLLPLADLDEDWQRIGVREPNPLADAVLRSKRAGRWRTTYAERFLREVDSSGRIHAALDTLQARTGRMAAGLAAQTLPSGDFEIRRSILADEGHVFISTDFQAIELRVLAALADVKRMREAIAAGEDLHGFTAGLIYGADYTPKHRKLAKAGGLGKVYGGGADALSQQTGAPIEDVRRMLAAYDRVYPEVKRASRRWQREAFQNGMVAISPVGRRLPLDRDRSYAIVNYLCQSTARDVLGQSVLNMEAAGLLPYLRFLIHDETLASAPKGEAKEVAREIEKCMTFPLFGVPIEAKAEIGGRSWGSLYGADF
ncbi:DNA polymerase-1 [Kitasatospora sp. MAP12-15]|uniref:DNA polymerase n=1 Tax=unclassified Kitasatospora TaxID=2633591 RepID=UPI0024765430|nr:DNA polymerase [Kitasatospora sp. MAP12-44]MDH6108844.1 DNA polymerase-1 [Kitasatospora sp. MAP12-44]